MALTIEVQTDEKVSLEQYIEYVSKNVNVRDVDSVCDSAWMLKALSNNKRFFTEILNKELSCWRDFQQNNSYTAQTFSLGKVGDFMVRANIWMPPSENLEERSWNDDMFYYLVPHDHNFSFMTIGFWGTGYETTIYEYDPKDIIGEVGEKVNMNFLEKTTLPEGKIMFYRANRDIHSQAHPKEFSISLNLMLGPPEFGLAEQYCFDFNTSSVTNHVQTTNAPRLMLCQLAQYVGNGKTVNLLESLAEKHPTARVRAKAYNSLAVLESNQAEHIWEKAAADKSQFVQKLARKEIGAMI